MRCIICRAVGALMYVASIHKWMCPTHYREHIMTPALHAAHDEMDELIGQAAGVRG